MNFFDRLSNGWTIAMNSFKLLKQNKQLIIFPILSSIALLLVLGSFVTLMLASVGWNADAIPDPAQAGSIVIMFLYYLVNYFVIVFFNMSLIHCTHLYFKGEEPSIEDGIKFSVSRLGPIFMWSILAATVGTILRLLQENFGTVGRIVVGLIGIVWSIATFFVVPVIAYENVGPIDAFKKSAQLMKEKWGERLGAGFSFGLVYLVGFLVLGGGLFLIGSIFNPLIGVVLAVLGVLLVSAVVSAAKTIFISAVYHNVTGDPTEHFNQQMVDSLFVGK